MAKATLRPFIALITAPFWMSLYTCHTAFTNVSYLNCICMEKLKEQSDFHSLLQFSSRYSGNSVFGFSLDLFQTF